MFAVVANGVQEICHTQRQLDTILALYSYPKFKKFSKEEEAYEWIRQHSRVNYTSCYNQYGDTMGIGFVSVTYSISNNTIYYHVNTEKFGYLAVFSSDKNVAIRQGRESLDIVVSNVVLDDLKISSHIIAIKRILILLGSYVDVDITVPDMSVYLAITKYKGNNYMIHSLKNDFEKRLGGVSFTIKEGNDGIQNMLL